MYRCYNIEPESMCMFLVQKKESKRKREEAAASPSPSGEDHMGPPAHFRGGPTSHPPGAWDQPRGGDAANLSRGGVRERAEDGRGGVKERAEDGRAGRQGPGEGRRSGRGFGSDGGGGFHDGVRERGKGLQDGEPYGREGGSQDARYGRDRVVRQDAGPRDGWRDRNGEDRDGRRGGNEGVRDDRRDRGGDDRNGRGAAPVGTREHDREGGRSKQDERRERSPDRPRNGQRARASSPTRRSRSQSPHGMLSSFWGGALLWGKRSCVCVFDHGPYLVEERNFWAYCHGHVRCHLLSEAKSWMSSKSMCPPSIHLHKHLCGR